MEKNRQRDKEKERSAMDEQWTWEGVREVRIVLSAQKNTSGEGKEVC